MDRFARLFAALDQTNATNDKVAAMREYFREAPPEDAAWAVYFLTGRRLKRLIPSASLRQWTVAATGIEQWLFDECYAIAGDGAETGASRVLASHGHAEPLARFLTTQGLESGVIRTAWEGEGDDS